MQHLFYYPNLDKSMINFEPSEPQTSENIRKEVWDIINFQEKLTHYLLPNQLLLTSIMEKTKQEEGQRESDDSSLEIKKIDIDVLVSPEEDLDDQRLSQESFSKVSDQQPLQVILGERLRKRKRHYHWKQNSQKNNGRQIKKCETKNAIKNFTKAMFNFIKKQQKIREKVLLKENIPQKQFTDQLNQLFGNVNNIKALRDLWVQNKYSKAFRIFSDYFIRKYYLKHTFNSRVMNYMIHIKYRQKFIESLENPEQFSVLKQF